jgi:hypothetical protein
MYVIYFATFRYINKLSEMHVNVDNYIEAAYTLLLHADTLSWENTHEWDKKESEYQKIIQYFDSGK